MQTLARYDQAYETAHAATMNAAAEVVAAARALDEMQAQAAQDPYAGIAADPRLATAETRYRVAQSTYNTLLATETKAADQRNDAYAKAQASDDPTARTFAAARASQAETDAKQAAAAYDEWQRSGDERKAETAAKYRLAGLQADMQQHQLDAARATDPLVRQQLQQQIATGGQALQQAQLDYDTAKQLAPIKVAQAEQGVKAGEQGLTEGQLRIEELRRQVRQAVTDPQAARAIELGLDQLQAGLEGTRAGTAATQAATERNKALLSGDIAQQGATLEQTRAATEASRATTGQLQQGTLYGLDQYIQAQKDAIAKGLLTPNQADQALQARIAGTDVFSASRAANEALMSRADQQIAQRRMETDLAGQKVSTYGSMANTGLGQFAALNNYIQPGSDAGGRALLGWMNLAQRGLNQYQAPPRIESPALPPMLQSFAGPQAQSSPSAGSVTINIGPGQQPTQQTAYQPQAMSVPQTSYGGAPAFNGMTQPSALHEYQPATPDLVSQFFANRYGGRTA